MAIVRVQKVPVVVEAIQYTGSVESEKECHGFARVIGKVRDDIKDRKKHPVNLMLPTLEGDMTCSPGDWIIKGVAGEFYPCKPDIFEQTYKPAPAPAEPATSDSPDSP